MSAPRGRSTRWSPPCGRNAPARCRTRDRRDLDRQPLDPGRTSKRSSPSRAIRMTATPFGESGARGRRRARGGGARQAPCDAGRCAAAGRARRARRPARSLAATRRGRAAKERSSPVTGSVGKTSTKEALRPALCARRRGGMPPVASQVQQSLGRAAVALPARGVGALRRVRDRDEPCGRDHAN